MGKRASGMEFLRGRIAVWPMLMSFGAMAFPSTVVELLQELIRIPSVNPDGEPGTERTGEADLAAYVAAFLREECGAEVELEEVLPGRPNLLGRFPGGSSGGRKVVLGPHLDTVGVAGMVIDPFGGEVREGKIWGRGASDTKGSLAAMLWALREERRQGGGDGVMFAGFMGEESAQHGSRHFARHHAEEAGFGVIGEPTEMQVVRAHKACWWLGVKVKGRAAHSSKPELGDNAVLKMADLIGKLNGEMARRLPGFADDVLGCPTLSINQCQGGVRANVVPDECGIVVDVRATPALHDYGVPRLLGECLAATGHESAAVRVIGQSPVLKTDPEHEMIRRLCSLGAGLAVAPWFCDAGWLAEAGIPAIAIGPGSIDQAHTVDEWIRVAELEEGARFFARFLRQDAGARSRPMTKSW